ncbi:MAG: MlaD family protein [Candidatus Dormibacteria bacterium]
MAVAVELAVRAAAVRGTPRVRPFSSGLVAAVLLAAAMVAVVVSGIPGGPGIQLPWNQVRTLKVVLVNADGLAPHASVDVAGVKVGEVHDVAASGNDALATLDIQAQYFDIHQDAQVLLRPHGLFGPKYIEINPGSAGAAQLSDGATIGVNQTVQPVDLNSVLQALSAPESQNLRTALVELGKAAAGQGDDVNHLLAASQTLTSTLQEPALTLDGVSNNLNDFIVQNEAFNASFAQTPLDQLVASSNVTLRAFADNSAALGSLLDHADSTLTQLDTQLGGNTAQSIRSTLETLPTTIQLLNNFNNDVGLFAANLTGKDPSVLHGTIDVTQGIIDAIENIKSAFSSYDCSVSTTPCPEADKEYYLRVQVFNLGNSGEAAASLQQALCSFPIPTLPTGTKLPCTVPVSYQSRPGVGVSTLGSNLAALIGP